MYNGTVRQSTLDHVYTNNVEIIESHQILKQPISDHCVIIASTTGKKKNKRVIEAEYDCWPNYTKDILLKELSEYDWVSLMGLGAQEMADGLDHILGTIKDRIVPKKVFKKRENEANVPAYLLEKKKKLRNLYKRAKKKSSVALMTRARTLEKQIRREMIISKRIKIRAEAQLGPTNLWKAVRISSNNEQSTIPPLSVEGLVLDSSKDKAMIFANSFYNKVKNITETLRPISDGPTTPRVINGIYEDNWITIEHVKNTMDNLPVKRCFGYDRIPLIFYKDGVKILLPVVTTLMKKVIGESTIPEQWKVARVIPIYKKGKRCDVNNYRPISNLCSVTKIFERLILDKINSIELSENIDLTGESQHGFKKGRSTETAGVEIQSRISQRCDLGEFVTVASIDLTAAFDVINHKALIKRMKEMGMPEIIVSIIKEWLSGRYFYCEVGGSTSELFKLEHGTVQGSILGPILFAIYISPLQRAIRESVIFADDNYVINHDGNKNEVIKKTILSVQVASGWLTDNGLKINQSKTEVCLFHKKDQGEETIVINNVAVPVLKQIKILGIIFDSKLDWHIQARNAMAKANKAKQALSLIRKFFDQEEMIKLATAYFYSTLYYGARVWLMTSLHHVLKKQLWQLSSRMLKIVNGFNTPYVSFMSLHKKFKRATPLMWCKYTTATAMWDLINNNVPEYTAIRAILNRQFDRRKRGMIFTRSNVSKIGFNCLSNRLQVVSKTLNVDWPDMSKRAFRELCKKIMIIDVLETMAN